MLINQSISSILHTTTIILFLLLFLALTLRILIGLLSLLAEPIYLLIHYFYSFFSKEFIAPKKGFKRLISNICGAAVFSMLLDTGNTLFNELVIKKTDPAFMLAHSQNIASDAQSLIMLAMFTTVCLLSDFKKAKSELKPEGVIAQESGRWFDKSRWFDKMRAIKFPPPFDWL